MQFFYGIIGIFEMDFLALVKFENHFKTHLTNNSHVDLKIFPESTCLEVKFSDRRVKPLLWLSICARNFFVNKHRYKIKSLRSIELSI